eukprot:12386501-Ditylum_brightwellii.AAC.1
MVEFLKAGEAGIKRTKCGQHGCCIHPGTRSTEGRCTDCIQQQASYVQKQTLDNLKHCLNAMTFWVFPKKAYKLQKRYIEHMMHKSSHISICKWIYRDVKSNNYLTEFHTPTRVEARKLEPKELLEVLKNGIPTTWKFQMDKEGFNVSSSMLKEFMETCVCYNKCKANTSEKTSTACKSHSKRRGDRKAKHKARKKAY